MWAWLAATAIILGVVALYGWSRYREGRESVANDALTRSFEQAQRHKARYEALRRKSDADLDRLL